MLTSFLIPFLQYSFSNSSSLSHSSIFPFCYFGGLIPDLLPSNTVSFRKSPQFDSKSLAQLDKTFAYNSLNDSSLVRSVIVDIFFYNKVDNVTVTSETYSLRLTNNCTVRSLRTCRENNGDAKKSAF